MDNKALEVISFYGVRHQLKKFAEEVFELNEAILSYEELTLNGKNIEENKFVVDKALAHIIEEMGDCFFLLSQFKEHYKINGKDIMEVVNAKANRQLLRMENEK